VVQPDHAAFPELVAATRGGMVCRPDDPKDLADALEKLLLDDQQREQYSLQGMAQVRSEFTATRMAERFEKVLAGVVA
jgi:glycosyltransferase involved in cell wall biosynthesis